MYAEHALESYNIRLTSYDFCVYNAIPKFTISLDGKTFSDWKPFNETPGSKV